MARRRLCLLAGLVLLPIALDRALPPDLSRARQVSLLILAADGSPIGARLSADGFWRLPARRADVDPLYLRLLIATEDKRFLNHPGVDPLALARAFAQRLRTGHVVSGGSTLTMQVARLLMPHRRTLTGKLVEIARALQLEERLSKDDILALYLTLAPMGGNIEGVRAGALAWFGHLPDHLSAPESALLVALPRSPARLRPDRHGARAVAVAASLGPRVGYPVGIQAVPSRHRLPSLSAGLTVRVRETGLVRTAIDPSLQRALIARALAYAKASADGGRVAILVVRNADRAVLAYVGCVDAAGPADQLDLLRAVRSPGSTLKPLIYAFGFDDGLLGPDTIVDDTPVSLGGWTPRDFDGAFRGALTAREALTQSLNAPAVRVLERVGPARFAASLAAAGVDLVLPAGPATLPLALGGVGLRPEDLASLYTGLADAGQVAPLRLLATDPPGVPRALVSRRAAVEVGDVLRSMPPPDGFAAPDRPIAYKTGTSFGFRDAWAAGFAPSTTVVVWTGRPDGTPRPDVSGAREAAPILFRVFDLLPPEPGGIVPARSVPVHGATRRRLEPDVPRIVYPPARSTVDAGGTGWQPVALVASGGRPPYQWAADGLPVPVPVGTTEVNWRPASVGFAHLTVIDAAGRSASADVRVK